MKRAVMLVAGEASGDLHGAGLVDALLEKDPDLFPFGLGGELMRRAGMRVVVDNRDLAVMGITDVLGRLPVLRKAYRQAESLLETMRPELLVLIDYPGFNLRLARKASELRIPVLYYISPKVWAWKASRVNAIREYVDRLALILPFEVEWFRERGVDQAEYVGNPLMDHAPEFKPLRPLPAISKAPVIGLLPGSREGEIRRLLPPMSEAAGKIAAKIPGARFLLSAAPGTHPAELRAFAASHGAPEAMEVVMGSGTIFDKADIVIAASGTVTLEAAVAGVPTVLVYRMSAASYAIARRVVKIPHAGLANLIAGDEVMPELLQEDANPEKIAETVTDIVSDPKRIERLHHALRSVRGALGEPGVASRCADLAMDMLEKRT